MSLTAESMSRPGFTWCYEHKHWVKIGEWHRDK